MRSVVFTYFCLLQPEDEEVLVGSGPTEFPPEKNGHTVVGAFAPLNKILSYLSPAPNFSNSSQDPMCRSQK